MLKNVEETWYYRYRKPHGILYLPIMAVIHVLKNIEETWYYRYRKSHGINMIIYDFLLSHVKIDGTASSGYLCMSRGLL